MKKNSSDLPIWFQRKPLDARLVLIGSVVQVRQYTMNRSEMKLHFHTVLSIFFWNHPINVVRNPSVISGEVQERPVSPSVDEVSPSIPQGGMERRIELATLQRWYTGNGIVEVSCK